MLPSTIKREAVMAHEVWILNVIKELKTRSTTEFGEGWNKALEKIEDVIVDHSYAKA
jgi:hypothetical protein